MKYYTFQPQFHDPIRSLIKTSTIRPRQKVSVGERFALRHWKGAPYRTKMGWLGTAVCVQVSTFQIDVMNDVAVDGEYLTHTDACERLATQEGFHNYAAMCEWFNANHPVAVFTGILTRWDPASFVAGEPS